MTVLDLLTAVSTMAGYADTALVHVHAGSLYCEAPAPEVGGQCDVWVLTDFGWTWAPALSAWVYPG